MALDCDPEYADRGDMVTCTARAVDPQHDTDETEYEWFAVCEGPDGENLCQGTKVSRGRGSHRWEGRVTGTSSVHVEIRLGDSIPGDAARNIIVRPRTGWTATAMGLLGTAKLQTRSLNPEGGPWKPGDFGRYVTARRSSLNFRHHFRERPVGGDELSVVDAEGPADEGLPVRPSGPVL